MTAQPTPQAMEKAIEIVTSHNAEWFGGIWGDRDYELQKRIALALDAARQDALEEAVAATHDDDMRLCVGCCPGVIDRIRALAHRSREEK